MTQIDVHYFYETINVVFENSNIIFIQNQVLFHILFTRKILKYPHFFHIFHQMLICSNRNWIAIIFVWFIYFKLSSILIHSAIKTCIITRYTNLFVNYCKNYFKFFKITWRYSMQLQLSMHTWSYTPLYFRINTREYILI